MRARPARLVIENEEWAADQTGDVSVALEDVGATQRAPDLERPKAILRFATLRSARRYRRTRR